MEKFFYALKIKFPCWNCHGKNSYSGIPSFFSMFGNTEEILEVAKSFFEACLDKMKEHLPYKEQVICDSEVIFLKLYDYQKWINLRDRFTNMIKKDEYNDFEDQLGRLKKNFSDLRLETYHFHVMDIWRRNKSKFPLLFKLAKYLMVIPYSSCSVERTFSQCLDIKTLKRNRLSVGNLEACLLVKQEYGNRKVDYDSKMIENYYSKPLKPEKIEEEKDYEEGRVKKQEEEKYYQAHELQRKDSTKIVSQSMEIEEESQNPTETVQIEAAEIEDGNSETILKRKLPIHFENKFYTSKKVLAKPRAYERSQHSERNIKRGISDTLQQDDETYFD